MTEVEVLVVNAGSTSVKLRLLDGDDRVVAGRDVGALPGSEDELAGVLSDWSAAHRIDAVGHRIVHGGPRLTEPVVVDDGVVRELEAAADLAPIHAGPALHALAAARSAVDVPHVACFDTAFHAGMPPAAATYALPRSWRDRYGLRRYGFHGLSHAYAARRAAGLLARDPAGLRLVTCHLGGGASLTAIQDGRSVDTTMGFTPLEGLVMATRSGSLDPGLVLWLISSAELPAEDVAHGLEYESGLLGLAGRQATFGVLAAAARLGDEDARLAVEVYLHRLVAGIAAMTASLGGLDALVFTGGVGEHEPWLRNEVASRLAFLGLEIDLVRNAEHADGADAVVSSPGIVHVLVVHAREDLEITRAVRRLPLPAGPTHGG